MEAAALNRVEIARIPESVRTDLCIGAIEMVQRHREDPGARERYEAFASERNRKMA